MPERLPVPLAPAQRSWGTGLIWLVPAVLVLAALWPDPDGAGSEQSVVKVLPLLLAAAFALLGFLAPRRLAYFLTPDALEVRTLSGTRRVRLAGLSARRSSGALGLRTFGVGLPGYSTGQFLLGRDQAGIQHVRAAASTATGGVLLLGTDRPLFLTPADPHAFLRELARRGVRVA